VIKVTNGARPERHAASKWRASPSWVIEITRSFCPTPGL
jgi:hypothetical protein